MYNYIQIICNTTTTNIPKYYLFIQKNISAPPHYIPLLLILLFHNKAKKK
jgi:hypothetical protein